MRVRLTNKDFQDIFLEYQYPFIEDASAPVVERLQEGAFFFGKGSYKELYFDGVHIGYGDLLPTKEVIVDVDSDLDSVEMHFMLSGAARTTINKCQPLFFHTGEHNILYAHEFKGSTTWSSKEQMKVFEINIQPALFLPYLWDEMALFSEFKNNIQQQRTSQFMPQNRKITPSMLTIIQDIMTCKRVGGFKKMYLQAKVIELLLLQLEQTQSTTILPTLKKKEIDRMYAIKALLESETPQSYTLQQLARKVGTNVFSLQQQFKHVFGTTVIAYGRQYQLKKSREWLLEGDSTIREIAERLGYAQPHHFTVAFKRQFGYLPSQCKL